MDLLRAIDQEAKRIGVTRQAFIKLRTAHRRYAGNPLEPVARP
jgi:hypothetical protein